jgi:hypothetical protein
MHYFYNPDNQIKLEMLQLGSCSKEEARSIVVGMDENGEGHDADEILNGLGYVRCDDRCMARKEPVTLDEHKEALDHWKSHSRLCGCSHGR